MTTKDRLDQHDEQIADIRKLVREIGVNIQSLSELQEKDHREMRQGFDALTQLHDETKQEIKEFRQSVTRLNNAMSALADHVGHHETRIDRLEGK
jgi:chromosome segregation ATPase